MKKAHYTAHQHKTGTDLSLANVKTASEAMAHAGLAWNVTSVPMYLPNGYEAEGFRAIVRQDSAYGPLRALGVVSERYHALSNMEAFGAFDKLVADGAARWDAAGSVRGGSLVWARLQLSDATVRYSRDSIERYLVLTTTHDGSGAVKVFPTMVRFLCSNALVRMWRNAEERYTIRHTATAEERIRAAVTALTAGDSATLETVHTFHRMAETSTNYAESREIFSRALNTSDVTVLDRLETYRLSGRGVSPETMGTLWGTYNALTDYLSHETPRRPRDEQSYYLSTVQGVRAQKLDRAFSVVSGAM